MRKLGCFLVILLCAGHFCSGATPKDSPTPAAPPGFVLEDGQPNSDKVSVHSDSLLGEAIKRLDLAGVQSALSKGANPNHIESMPLVRSSFLRDTVIYGSFQSGGDREREAAQNSCLQILKALFESGAKIQAVDGSILDFPIGAGHADVVALLLSKGADANGKSEDGLSWVEMAEAYDQVQIVNLLKKHGGKPISPGDAVQLKYLQALRTHSFIQMERWLREGARLNDGYKNREPALSELFRFPIYDCEGYAMLLFLLKKGANPNTSAPAILNGPPGIPLHRVVYTSTVVFRVVSERRNQKGDEMVLFARLTLEALLEAGANVAARDTNGRTPLHVAAQRNNLVAAQLLLKAGSTVMPRDDAGKTPLDYAESADMIKLLKDHGATEQ